MQGKPDRPPTPRVAIVLLVLCCIYGLTQLRGCQSGPVYYKITGVVRVAGEPVGGIQVNFYPDDPNKLLASGLTNSDGRFALYSGVSAIEGCQEAKAKVTFVALEGVGGGGGGRGGEGGPGEGGPGGPGEGGPGGPGEGGPPSEGGRGGSRPDAGTSSNGLQLAPDMPRPPFALEYSYTTTTPVRYDVTEDAEVDFDLLEFGSTEVPLPGESDASDKKKTTS